MKRILSLLTVFAITGFSYAQVIENKVDGSVSTIEKPVVAATISLLKAGDSSLVKMAVSDKTGKFEVTKFPNGKYLVLVTAVGFTRYYSETFELSTARPSYTLKEVALSPVLKSLQGVTVTSKKPLIEQRPGMTVLNVDASPTNTGTNALELLEKSPGVSVDNDGNISLKGKQGVLILIDGKPTHLSPTDLAAFLKNMQSSNLEQIEIMTNPPAKYDAAGNSGIINIKTKKGNIKGINGTATAGYTQGYYSRFNGGANLNYRNNKLNLFGGFN
ncbi:MAG: TonB-dependent receptor, partial [Segetibacter sp.]